MPIPPTAATPTPHLPPTQLIAVAAPTAAAGRRGGAMDGNRPGKDADASRPEGNEVAVVTSWSGMVVKFADDGVVNQYGILT